MEARPRIVTCLMVPRPSLHNTCPAVSGDVEGTGSQNLDHEVVRRSCTDPPLAASVATAAVAGDNRRMRVKSFHDPHYIPRPEEHTLITLDLNRRSCVPAK